MESTTPIPGLTLGQEQEVEKSTTEVSQDTPMSSEEQKDNASQTVRLLLTPQAPTHSNESMDVDVQDPVTDNHDETVQKVDLSDDVDMKATGLDAPGSPVVTDALEAALAAESDVKSDDLAKAQESTATSAAESNIVDKDTIMNTAQENVVTENTANVTDEAALQGLEEDEGEHPEWEIDSSPYESTDSSSDSSDDDSDDENYPILGIEETARMLMAMDHDGDGAESRTPAQPIRSKNEKPEEVLPKPDVQILPEDQIELLGQIQFIVENNIVIKSSKSAAEQVLDTGTVLCKEDRTVIGALADVIGNVRDPMYTVGFAKEEEIKELGLEAGMSIFFPTKHANSVFTKPLMEVKHTDASNIHDEEVLPGEMEFSDDEKEAEYRRKQKQEKQFARDKKLGIAPRAGRGGRGGKFGRGGGFNRGAQHSPSPSVATSTTLDYDDDDGPYRPLARPPGFGLPTRPPSSSQSQPSINPRGGFHDRGNNRGRGNFRGRGNRDSFRGHGNEGGPRGFGHSRQSSVSTSSSAATSTTMPAFSANSTPPAYNSHIPPPFPPVPPATQGTWPSMPPIPFPPPPQGYTGAQQAPRPPIPGQPQPPTGGFTFNYPAWPQLQAPSQGQQYTYPQAAPVPPTQQTSGYSQPPSAAQPNWAGAAAILQNLAQGAYGQQAQQQAQQQTAQQTHQARPAYQPPQGYQAQAAHQGQQQQQYSAQQPQTQQNGGAQQAQQQNNGYWQR